MSTSKNTFEGSFAGDEVERQIFDSNTKNYPSAGDTTSSGGYSASPNVWSDKSQRGGQDPYRKDNATGAIDQSLNGGDLKSEILNGDAQQGEDETSGLQ